MKLISSLAKIVTTAAKELISFQNRLIEDVMKLISSLAAVVTIFASLPAFAADAAPDLTNKTLVFDIIVNLGPVNSDYGSKFLLINKQSNLAAFVSCRSGDII